MKTIRPFFRNRLVALLLIVLIVSIFVSNVEVGTWGFSKTVGWAWDLTPINLFFFCCVTVMSLLFYAASALLTFRTNKTLVRIQFTLIASTALFFKTFDVFIVLVLNVLSLVIFIVSVLWVIRLAWVTSARNHGLQNDNFRK